MNGLDYTLIALAACGLILGYMRGFVAQILSFAGFFIAYMIAFKFYRDCSPILQGLFPLPTADKFQNYTFIVHGLHLDTYVFNALSFALLFFGTKLVLSIIGRVLNLITQVPGLNLINRWSGALLGLAEAALIIIIAVNVMSIAPSGAVQKLLSGSIIAPFLINEIPAVAGKLQGLWKQGVPL